jgi:ribosomal protein S14
MMVGQTMTADNVVPLIQPRRCAACGASDGVVRLAAVADPNGSVRNFYLHAACERDFLAKLPEVRSRVRNALLCDYCNKPGGVMEHASYIGVPDGGVPVHRDCLVAWFKKMDATGWEGK